jgi:hypothetical protein
MSTRFGARISAATIAAALVWISAPAQPATASIDRRPGVEVGAYRISRYLVEKYHNRFADSIRSRQHRQPSLEDSRAWLDLFIAQQVIIAHEQALGQDRRPEVATAVSRMERYMLTQEQGPFYDELFDHEIPPTAVELKTLYDHAANMVDGVIVRFSEPASAAQLLGQDFQRESVDGQTSQILRLRERNGIALADGQLFWPFLPFSEVSEVIEGAPIGRWIAYSDPDFGQYEILVRRNTHRSAGNWQADMEGFRRWYTQVRRQMLFEQRQVKLLKSVGFVMDDTTAAFLLDHCRRSMTALYKIPPITATSNAGRILFQYRIGTETAAITVEEFSRHFNDQLVRTIIREISDLRQQCEQFATEELDYHAAKAQGVDQTAQFTEDRFGFTGQQILNLFERETLAPKITIDSSRIERYYREHLPEFRHTTRIRGRVLEFKTLEEAMGWRSQTAAPNREAAGPGVIPANDREIELAATESVPGFEQLHDALFACTKGSTFGPVQNGQSYDCFIKENDLQAEPEPIEDVSPSILGILQRKELDSEELKLAAEWSKNVDVKVAQFAFAEPAPSAIRISQP